MDAVPRVGADPHGTDCRSHNLKIIGGFTGPAAPEIHEVDLDQLSHADATRLRELVATADFFSLPPEIRKRAPASWDFVHELTVRDAGKTHTVCSTLTRLLLHYAPCAMK